MCVFRMALMPGSWQNGFSSSRTGLAIEHAGAFCFFSSVICACVEGRIVPLSSSGVAKRNLPRGPHERFATRT